MGRKGTTTVNTKFKITKNNVKVKYINIQSYIICTILRYDKIFFCVCVSVSLCLCDCEMCVCEHVRMGTYYNYQIIIHVRLIVLEHRSSDGFFLRQRLSEMSSIFKQLVLAFSMNTM